MGLTPTTSRGSSSSGAGTELAYAVQTTDVTISGVNSAGANTIVTAPAFTADGSSSVLVEFFTSAAVNGAAGTMVVELWLDGVAVCIVANPQLSAESTPIFARSAKQTPAAGSRTYSIRAWRGGSNGTVIARAGTGGAFSQAYIRVVQA